MIDNFEDKVFDKLTDIQVRLIKIEDEILKLRSKETIQPSHMTPIGVLEPSTRIENALKRKGISTVEELSKLSMQEVYYIKDIGKTSLAEIHCKLNVYLGRPLSLKDRRLLECYPYWKQIGDNKHGK